MKLGNWQKSSQLFILALFAAVVLQGCATSKINWDTRVEKFTYDDAVVEMGPPDKSAKLTDGTTVAEWLTLRGLRHGSLFDSRGFAVQSFSESSSPDQYLRLTFAPDGKLKAWKSVYK